MDISTVREQVRDGLPTDRSDEQSDPTVTMVATPGDGSCGIGTYARDLRAAFDDVTTTEAAIDQDDRSFLTVLSLAVRVMFDDSDVVHVQHEYGLFRRSGVPYPGIMGLVFFPVLAILNLVREKTVVVTMHSVIELDPREAPRRIRLYLLLMHELIAATADHLVFLSEDCAEDFRADVALEDDECSVFPHGVNTTAVCELSREAAKERIGFDPDDTVVAIPGFVRPPKGHDIFVEVAEQFPEYEFLIAGGARPKGEDADFAAEIDERAGENVTMTGVLEDELFPVALASADLALLPYREVSQSGTFNWCVAQECPILANDVSYFTRMERRWGNVETVDIEDREALVSRVQELLEDEERCTELRLNCRRYKHANSFETVAREHGRIYRGETPSGKVDARENRLDRPRAEATGRGTCSARSPLHATE